MLRIVPSEVDSGSDWGSDTEADARDYGRFKRIENADQDTIRYFFLLISEGGGHK